MDKLFEALERIIAEHVKKHKLKGKNLLNY
jgi:hypothetical protein